MAALFHVVIPVLRRLSPTWIFLQWGAARGVRDASFRARPAGPAGVPAPSLPLRHSKPAGMHAREIRTHTKAVARLNAFGTDVLRNTNVAAQRAGKAFGAFGLRFGRGGALPPAPKVAVSGR